jgi:hypothetical protein
MEPSAGAKVAADTRNGNKQKVGVKWDKRTECTTVPSDPVLDPGMLVADTKAVIAECAEHTLLALLVIEASLWRRANDWIRNCIRVCGD